MTNLTYETLFSTQTQPENERLALLKQHFPNCFDKHGAFLPDKLAEILHSDGIATQKEGYSLNWLGKSYARVLKDTPPETLLSEDVAHNQQPENANSENLLIKGDNLEVLKHLKHAYKNQIKMIYIDPPYNTGSDGFVYQDDRQFTPEQLAQLGGMSLEEAQRVLEFTAKKSNSHSAWLTFMYPRLYVARELLRDDGVIFISIDDNEQAQLKILCDEVFGEENFVSAITIQGTANESNEGILIQSVTDYCFCYAKNKNLTTINKIDLVNEDFRSLNDAPSGLASRKYMGYSIYYNPETQDIIPKIDYNVNGDFSDLDKIYTDDIELLEKNYIPIRPKPRNNIAWRWRWGIETLIERKNELNFRLNRNQQWAVEFKQSGFNAPRNYQEFGTGTILLKSLFDGKEIFSKPKSVSFLDWILSISVSSNDLILDFFAGSGTTAHAIMQLNAEDKGNRRFICVQLPEKTDEKSEAYKAGYETIFDITKARIEKVSAKIRAENSNYSGDLGFKIFETVPLFDFQAALNDDFDPAQAEIPDSKNAMLSDEQLHMLLTTWRVYDGCRLPEKVQTVDLAGYTAYYCRHHLYLLASGFHSECVKALIEKLDNDKDFVPERIVLFSANMESAMQKELAQAVKTYANKKGLNNLSVLARV
ncbi:site-specific DNA-methyltransferase [Wielerella bovis]|uniref:site-specific DNA-methyltransferase n=1 Tax=Wielerella bovis TaxID=2917790 RepID=UPI0020198E51|nr:DNA methyltransferase [Wielerella bovis]MCG7657500.1 site-specific DNA-methyltransferase [Wielerella bovis]MCG7659721.1 site-specific DNA-methyltransferase [Wielerella bovis]